MIEKYFYFEEYKAPKFYINFEIINLFNFIELIKLSNIPFIQKAKMQMKIYSLETYIFENNTDEKNLNMKKFKHLITNPGNLSH